ncbi:large conductance mechanosensitive channel protein MscL [Lederbergia citrea]|uniref:large conductance mechanosensitive channel protein MscL n=1 Tax=Lederbergia citrea TaxID=2833581 RepID=UPI001BC9DA4E|nr:large conductance mechanosensitive channel protein MscL [Lederbergia citrea]MBS4178688.1 large conductance mechanosensitive channel protein MscL [Lederbergia citrea]
MWKEFKKLAIKGNVLDITVAVVIGTSFRIFVDSLVDNIIMPLIGILLGGKNFHKLMYRFGDTKIEYGKFIESSIHLLIIALSIFWLVKVYGKIKQKKEIQILKKPSVIAPEVELLAEIRDLLKKKNL